MYAGVPMNVPARVTAEAGFDARVGGRRVGREQLGDAEVEHLHALVARVRLVGDHHDVLGLEIAVHDAELVRDHERVADLDEDAHRARLGDGALALEQDVQVVALEQLHGDVADRPGDAVVDDLHRVRVLHPLGGLGLALEPLHEGAVRVQLVVHDLERDELRLLLLLGDVDRRHAALAEEALDGEASRHLAAYELALAHARRVVRPVVRRSSRQPTAEP
ncbi:MAG: hypothetical protein QM820_41820 [Minicystis sp.]